MLALFTGGLVITNIGGRGVLGVDLSGRFIRIFQDKVQFENLR